MKWEKDAQLIRLMPKHSMTHWKNMHAIWQKMRAKGNLIRLSGVMKKSAGQFRCCHGAPKTIRCWLVNRALVKRQLSKDLLCVLWTAMFLKLCVTNRFLPVQNIVASLKSAWKLFWQKFRQQTAKSSCLSMKCTLWLVPVNPMALWTHPTCWNPPLPVANFIVLVQRHLKNIANMLKKMRLLPVVSNRFLLMSPVSKTPFRFFVVLRKNTSNTIKSVFRIQPLLRLQLCPTGILQTGFCRIKRLTLLMKQLQGCVCRLIPSRKNSMKLIVVSCSWRSSAKLWKPKPILRRKTVWKNSKMNWSSLKNNRMKSRQNGNRKNRNWVMLPSWKNNWKQHEIIWQLPNVTVNIRKPASFPTALFHN